MVLEHCHFPNKGLKPQLLPDNLLTTKFITGGWNLLPCTKYNHLNHLKRLYIATKGISNERLSKVLVTRGRSPPAFSVPFPLINKALLVFKQPTAFTYPLGWFCSPAVRHRLHCHMAAAQGETALPFLTLLSQGVTSSLPVAPSGHKGL